MVIPFHKKSPIQHSRAVLHKSPLWCWDDSRSPWDRLIGLYPEGRLLVSKLIRKETERSSSPAPNSVSEVAGWFWKRGKPWPGCQAWKGACREKILSSGSKYLWSHGTWESHSVRTSEFPSPSPLESEVRHHQVRRRPHWYILLFCKTRAKLKRPQLPSHKKDFPDFVKSAWHCKKMYSIILYTLLWSLGFFWSLVSEVYQIVPYWCICIFFLKP